MLNSYQTLTLNIGKSRRPYRKPQLRKLGDLRTLTLGGSPGVGDSGSPGTRKPPGAGLIIENLPPPEDLFGTPIPQPGEFPPP
jgi:hypothetical protein